MQRQTYQNLKGDQGQFQSLTGYSLMCFNLLYPYFEVQRNQYHSHFTIAGQERRRPLRPYKNHVFDDTQSSLLFILYYLRNNPLQQAQTAMFGMSQPQANFWIHLLKGILLKALKSAKSLPCRDFDSLQKLLEEGQDVLLDGSERPIPRPADQEVQKEYYSGKKTHTVKNTPITSMINKALYLSPTYEGRVHDKSICDEEQIRFDVSVVLWEDLGFIGLKPDNADVKIPIKKPKKKELLAQEKAFNKQVSSKRVKVEHTIGQCKVFRIVKDEVRAFKDDFRDTCMLLACALNNFKMDAIKT